MASTNHQGASSLVQTTFNMSNVIMGVGVLSLPYAFQQSGWLLGIFLVTGFGLIASKSARILADIQRYVLATEGRALVTYGDIGEAVFGRRGKVKQTRNKWVYSTCSLRTIIVEEQIG